MSSANPNNNVLTLLQQGVEKARAGERAAARELFERVVELDENNEKGWFWLASVVDTDEERRICLANVVQINPANDRAKQALAALDAKKKKAVEDEEVVPGISRRTLTLLIGGAVAVVALVLVLVVVIVSNNNRVAQELAAAQTAQQIAFVATGTAFVVQGTGTAVAATETQAAIASPTPLPSNTPNIATLPPTWTPLPPPTEAAGIAALPPPVGVNGFLAAYRGRDVLATGDLPLGVFNLGANLQWQAIAGETGRDPDIYLNGARIVYSSYNPIDFTTVIEAINFNGSEAETFADRWTAIGVPVFDAQTPRYSDDGLSLVVIGRPQGFQTNQVFVSSIAPIPVGVTPPSNYIRQLTDDQNIDYSYASLSPDGRSVVVVREVLNAQPSGPDLVLIDLDTGGQIPLTNDYSTTTETQPRWSPDGSQIVYAAALANEANNYDLFVIGARGGSPTPLYRDPAEDRYPVISPDGRHLAFASDRNGAWDIYIYEIATATLFQLTNDRDDDFPSDWWLPPNQ